MRNVVKQKPFSILLFQTSFTLYQLRNDHSILGLDITVVLIVEIINFGLSNLTIDTTNSFSTLVVLLLEVVRFDHKKVNTNVFELLEYEHLTTNLIITRDTRSGKFFII